MESLPTRPSCVSQIRDFLWPCAECLSAAFVQHPCLPTESHHPLGIHTAEGGNLGLFPAAAAACLLTVQKGPTL